MEKKHLNIKVINILWEKIPFDFEIIKTKNSESDFGLYQVYGKHNVYGQNALLYIGQSNIQKFSNRLKDRWEFIESSCIPKFICLGKIVKSKNASEPFEYEINEWEKIINIAEKILIKTHTPAMNKQDVTGLFNKEQDENYLILNWGDYGKLLPEVSNLRFSYKYWDYEIPLVHNNL